MTIAVVGGGPGGSAAATLLARRGHRVTMFERYERPRERVCGEFISADALPVLAAMGVGPCGWPIRTAHVFGKGGRELEAPLPKPGSFGMERAELDPMLRAAAKRAGVEVRFQEVRELSAESVDGEVFEAVIDATGRFPLSRGAGTPLEGFGYRAAFDGGVPADRVELHLFPGGYAGLSGVGKGRANVCMLAPRDLARKHGGDLDAAFREVVASSVSLQEHLGSARRETPWASTGFPRTRFAGCHRGGIWYVGDAAGTVAPLGGEGIAMALRGGAILAATYESGPVAYERKWRAEFGARMRWCRALSALAVRPRAAALGFAFLGRFPGLFRKVVAATRG